jgi:methyltransferase (TIGR00027 family)
MQKRIETKSSRTAEYTCIVRAASSLEKDIRYKSDDTIALKILPQPIKYLIQIPFYRMLHCRFGVPNGIYEYVIARTKYMDAVYKKAISDKFDQIVILGAGYDTRAIRFPAIDDHTKIYEFDAKYTQQMKLNFYEKSGISMPLNIRFEAIDFVKESLRQRFETIGFQKNKRSLFIMEGVSMYLEPEAIHNTFLTVTDYMGRHSCIAFDYVYSDVIRHEKKHYGETQIIKSVSRVNEAWRFGIEKNKIEQFLLNYGLSVINHMNSKDIEDCYFKDDQGRMLRHVNDTHCLVTAEK